MNYCHLIESSGTGTLQVTINLANEQSKNKNDSVTVIYSKRKSTPKNFKENFNKNVNLVLVDMSNVFKIIIAMFILLKLLNKINPNVLFLHSSIAGAVGRLACFFSRKKILVLYIPHAISFLNTLDFNFYQRWFLILIENFLNIQKSIYIAVTRSEKIGIKKKILFSKCELIENALNLKKKKRKKFNNKNIIVMTGEIRKKKGAEDFGNIARKILKKNKNIKFIWVGDGEESLKIKLVNSGVNVTGWLPNKEVFKILSQSNIYLTASKYEGMSISVLEAIFFEAVVVAFKCDGHKDIIKHSYTGFLFKDEKQAVNIILNLLKNKNKLKRITNNSLIENKEKFSLNIFFKKYNKLIQNNLTKK